jgi:hypothetical protein
LVGYVYYFVVVNKPNNIGVIDIEDIKLNRNIDALIFGALLFGTYLFLYKLNFVAPLNHEVYSNYTTRIWEWSQNLIGFSAFITFVLNWRMARPKNIIIGLILGIICH